MSFSTLCPWRTFWGPLKYPAQVWALNDHVLVRSIKDKQTRTKVFALNIQGVPKVPHTFVFVISSKSLRAQNKFYARLKRRSKEFFECHFKKNLTQNKNLNSKTKNCSFFVVF
jgi:hypothetical protein